MSKKEKGLVIGTRDRRIVEEVARWRFCLGRQLRLLAGFTSARACDRRLKKLIDAGYIVRQYLLYGLPGLYLITSKASHISSVRYVPVKIKLEQIYHDIAVIDTAIYIHETAGVLYSEILSERELHGLDGFANRKHQPDFIVPVMGLKPSP